MMRGSRLLLAMVSMTGSAMLTVHADAQDIVQQRKALGSRVGDRDQDPNNAGLNGDRRTTQRLETRIDSRLKTRLERFDEPLTNYSDATVSKTDDGTKKR